MRRIGGLWKHKSKDKGTEYLAGTVEFLAGTKTNIVVFKAKEKKTNNSPDYILYVSEPMNKDKPVKVASEDVF